MIKKITITTALITALMTYLIYAHDEQEHDQVVTKADVVEIKQKIKNYREKTAKVSNDIKKHQEALSEKTARRKERLQIIKKEVADLNKQKRELMTQHKVIKNEIKDYDLQFSVLREMTHKQIIAFENKIREGIPYKISSRTDDIKRLLTDISFATISAEEIYNRFYHFLEKELILGMDSEVFSEGDKKYIRLGWVLMGYAEIQGDRAGILKKENHTWLWEESLDLTERQNLKDALKMVEGKKAPELIAFPIHLSALKIPKKTGDYIND